MRFLSVLLVLLGLLPHGAWAADDPPKEADVLVQEAEALWSGGDRAAIDAKLRLALAIREAHLPADHPLIVAVLARIGDNAFNRRDFRSAVQIYRRALFIEERVRPRSRDTARLLGSLGAALRESGDYTAAEALVRRSLELRHALVPADNAWIAAGLHNLADILVRQGRFTEAKPLVAEALAISRNALGPNHQLVHLCARQLTAIQDGLNPWGRMMQQVGWSWAVCILLLIVVAIERVHGEMHAAPDRHQIARLGVLLVSGAVAAYSAARSAQILVSSYVPDLHPSLVGNVGVLAGMLGLGAVFYGHTGITNVARLACGLPVTLPKAKFWQRRTIEEMLDALGYCGVAMREGVGPERLFREQERWRSARSRTTIENGGYAVLLVAMGEGEIASDHGQGQSHGRTEWLSDAIWHFDYEAIYEHGDYKSIVDNLCRLTQGALVFDDVKDYVAIDDGTAWIELTNKGKTDRLDLKVDADWVDPAIFAKMQRYLVAAGSKRRFAEASLGQESLFVCLRAEQLTALNRETGLAFREIKIRA